MKARWDRIAVVLGVPALLIAWAVAIILDPWHGL